LSLLMHKEAYVILVWLEFRRVLCRSGVVYQQNLNGAGWTDLPGSSLSGLADGSYQFRAAVTDNAGNSSNTTAISVVVDNTAPTEIARASGNHDDTGHTDTAPPITSHG